MRDLGAFKGLVGSDYMAAEVHRSTPTRTNCQHHTSSLKIREAGSALNEGSQGAQARQRIGS
jgi:hypothetical protein